jgi:hypothetical protein
MQGMSDREGYLKRRDSLLMQDEYIKKLETERDKLRKIVADGINTCQQHDRGLLPVSLIVWEAEAIKKLAALEGEIT